MANIGVVPALRYRNAPAAIAWLCGALGFERQLVVPGPDGTVAHAQLTFGSGMIMLGTASEIEPQTPCLIVTDCDEVYRSAKAAGAEMVRDFADMEYGGRAFTCRDPEGHVWSVGSYNPWA
jgi:uncharacterized glyoxalase superfamily protein PhnB